MIWRYALLILLTTGIGAFSGLIDPILSARAVILNLCLALSFPLLGSRLEPLPDYFQAVCPPPSTATPSLGVSP